MRLLGRGRRRLCRDGGEHPAYVRRPQVLKTLGPDVGDQVEADVGLGLGVCRLLAVVLDEVLQPVRQPFGELGRAGRGRDALAVPSDELLPLRVALLPGRAVHGLPLPGAVGLREAWRSCRNFDRRSRVATILGPY